YTSDAQKETIEKFIAQLSKDKVYNKKIVTEIKPLDTFFEAEAYHHEYYKKNPDQGYCQIVINPKLAKFKAKYSKLLKNDGT
ncbi:MAG: peptide-methionine (S)-S-oxide reductase, partial [Candidatus Buchananbacteria bacterium CG10_big_fil_rev_8_21_14_0_10_42_9]